MSKETNSVLIVGATSDIGKEIVQCYAKLGCELYVTGCDMPRLNSITKSIQEKYPIKILEYKLDITDYASHSSFVESLPKLPDTVVCCVGYSKDQEKSLVDFSEAYQTMSVNYVGVVSLLNLFANQYQKQKSGSIIAISSVAGVRGRQMNFLYGSAKAGLSTYLSGLRNRLFSYNVSVTTILLGPVYTRLTKNHKLMPLLTGKPEQVAEKIVDAGQKKKGDVYILWHWRWIMLIIQLIPEFIFKRLKPF